MKTLTICLYVLSLSAHAAQDTADIVRSVFNQSIQQQSTQSQSTQTQSAGAVNEGTATTTPSTPKVVATPATTPATTSAQPSINPAAQQGQQSQNSGSQANQAAGTALMAAGAALMSNPTTMPAGMALMAMGALAMMQGGHDSGAAGQSAATYGATAYGNPTGTNSSGTSYTDPAAGSAGYNNPQLAAGLKTLGDAGYKVTSAGVTKPDGTFVPSSSFSSPGAMAAAGFDPTAVKEAQKATAALNDEISKLNAGRVSSVALSSDGGGGGGGGAGGDSGSGDRLTMPTFTNPFAMSPNDKKQMVAGKTVMFDGEPIGVRGQNIFDMMHAAYQRQRAAKNFIENDNGIAPVTNRGPASLPQFKKK